MKRKQRIPKLKKNEGALKWGIIGTGYMGKIFTDAINRSKDNIPYAVCSRNETKAKEFAKERMIPFHYNNLTEFLTNEAIDIVYIATPLETHYHYTKQALLSGKNVLCEKPFVRTTEEFEELRSLAKKNNLFLMEGLWSILLPTMQQADTWISEDKIGETYAIRADKFRRKNYLKTKVKSVLLDYGIYPIAFTLHFLTNSKIKDFTGAYLAHDIDTDWSIVLKDGEKTGIMNLSGRFDNLSQACIIGTKGSVVFDSHFNRTNAVNLYDLAGKLAERKVFKYDSDGFEYEINEVNRCVRNGLKESPMVNLELSRKCIEIMSSLKPL